MLTREQTVSAAAIVDRWLRAQLHVNEWPGLSITIRHDDTDVLSRSYGFADIEGGVVATPNTTFRIASVSKTFTAIALMQLVDEGTVRLDDRASRFLPWLRGKDGSLAEVTLRQLLTHTSGIVRDGSAGQWHTDVFPDDRRLQQEVNASAVVYQPSSQLKYSNIGYSILGAVVTSVREQPFETVVRQRILAPLDLRATDPGLDGNVRTDLAAGYSKRRPDRDRERFPTSDAAAMGAATGFTSNPNDLCVYMQAQFLGDSRLISDAAKREMARTQWHRPGSPDHQGIGYQIWPVEGFTFLAHGGSFAGYRTKIAFDPEQRLALAVCANAIDVDAQAILTSVAHIMRHVINASSADHAAGPATDAYVGCYESRWGDVQVADIGGRLEILDNLSATPGAGAYRLTPRSDHRFLQVGEGLYGGHGEDVTFVVEGRIATSFSDAGTICSRREYPEPVSER